jgi:hypothetical protein
MASRALTDRDLASMRAGATAVLGPAWEQLLVEHAERGKRIAALEQVLREAVDAHVTAGVERVAAGNRIAELEQELARAQADAWDEGAAAVGPAPDEGEHFCGNPYRAAAERKGGGE